MYGKLFANMKDLENVSFPKNQILGTAFENFISNGKLL